MACKLFPYKTLQNGGPDQDPPIPYEERLRFGSGSGWNDRISQFERRSRGILQVGRGEYALGLGTNLSGATEVGDSLNGF